VGIIPGETMEARRQHLIHERDDLRTFLMYEPRGHGAMSGAILQPPTRPDADWGVLYIEVAGCLPMCGHGTIGVATVLVETGMVEVHEPTTTIRLDTPAGLVVAEVAVRDGRAEHVTIRNVASFATALDAHVDVPGYGSVRYDMAFGGNFYAIVELDEVGVPFGREHARDLMALGLAVMDAIEVAAPPVHPGEPGIHGCHHAQLVAPGSTAEHSRHAMVIRPGYFDRSPCGTGTSARMAQLHARGLLGLDADFVNTSLLDRPFIGRLVEATTVAGVDAVVPTITGSAWVTGTSQYVLDPTDPFPTGFLLG
jgi:proline racemase